MWASYWADRRSFAIRDKPAEAVVRAAYAAMASNSPPVAVGEIPPESVRSGDRRRVNVTPYFHDSDGDRLIYTASSSNPGVVQARTTGTVLEITATMAGNATVTVTATDPGGLSATQSFTVTVSTTATVPFTDDPIQPGATPVRAVHFTELRSRIDALRIGTGLERFAWTDPVLRPGVTRVRRVHLLELRAALVEAYRAAGRAAPSWTDTSPAAGSTPIQAAHLNGLRVAVLALE